MFLLVLPGVMAINLTIDKQSSNEVLIIGLDTPTIFEFEITNNGPDDYFEFYNLLGFYMSPTDKISIKNG